MAARDITSRKKAEKELIRHRDHLQELVDAATADLNFKARELKRALEKEQELNELQRRFVAMASHELRTPLAIIDSSAQRLKRRLDNNELTAENVDKRVGKIRGAVQRMIRLIESTMSVARMDEGKLEVNFGPCNVAEVLKAACSSQQEISENHIISCELLDLPETIPADRRALEQVLANLLSNAVKYAAHAPVIDVTAFSAVSDVIISVQDYGIGIDADDLNRIGERFFRAKTSAGIEGTGIGLNLVKTLVEMHDGTLKVESERDKGSKFIIRIPITRQLRQEPTEKGQARLF